MAKRELLKLPGTFEQALSDLLQTPPAPARAAKPLPTAKQLRKAVNDLKKGTRKKGR